MLSILRRSRSLHVGARSGCWKDAQQLDDLKLRTTPIVIYTTDNGSNMFSCPDAANTPFRSEKDSNWEGAFRIPAMIRWTGHIKTDTWSNEIVSGEDWFPTLLAAAGDPNIKEQLLKGAGPGDMAHKVHLDGYNILPYLECASIKLRDANSYFVRV